LLSFDRLRIGVEMIALLAMILIAEKIVI